jgi:hypothetical protein
MPGCVFILESSKITLHQNLLKKTIYRRISFELKSVIIAIIFDKVVEKQQATWRINHSTLTIVLSTNARLAFAKNFILGTLGIRLSLTYVFNIVRIDTATEASFSYEDWLLFVGCSRAHWHKQGQL